MRTIKKVLVGAALLGLLTVASGRLERRILRHLVDSAYARQRKFLSLQTGDDSWEPTQEELEQVRELFKAAKLAEIPVPALAALKAHEAAHGATSE